MRLNYDSVSDYLNNFATLDTDGDDVITIEELKDVAIEYRLYLKDEDIETMLKVLFLILSVKIAVIKLHDLLSFFNILCIVKWNFHENNFRSDGSSIAAKRTLEFMTVSVCLSHTVFADNRTIDFSNFGM